MITTLAVVVITVGVAVALFYIIRILRAIDDMALDLKQNVDDIRTWVRNQPLVQRWFGHSDSTSSSRSKRRKPRAKRDPESNEPTA